MVDPIYYRGITVRPQGFGVELDTNAIVETLAKDTKTKLAKVLRESFPRSGEQATSELSAIIAGVNKTLAEDTRKQISRAYRAGKKKRRPYRSGDTGKLKRYSDGQMDKGIAAKNFIQGDGRGINISLSVLDTYAKQWARLNFGAGSRGSRDREDNKIKLFRKTLQDSPSLSRIGARPGFMVPPTRRAIGVSSDKAYGVTPGPRSIAQTQQGPYLYLYPFNSKGLPKRKFKTKLSKGIKGWRFLDAGISYMNKEYGSRLTPALNTWVKTLEAKVAKSASTKVESRPKVSASLSRSQAASKGWETRRNRQAEREAERKRRSEAAKRGAETRRKNAERERRSEAARRGWETRRRRRR